MSISFGVASNWETGRNLEDLKTILTDLLYDPANPPNWKELFKIQQPDTSGYSISYDENDYFAEALQIMCRDQRVTRAELIDIVPMNIKTGYFRHENSRWFVCSTDLLDASWEKEDAKSQAEAVEIAQNYYNLVQHGWEEAVLYYQYILYTLGLEAQKLNLPIRIHW